jgi:hypothetical protein
MKRRNTRPDTLIDTGLYITLLMKQVEFCLHFISKVMPQGSNPAIKSMLGFWSWVSVWGGGGCTLYEYLSEVLSETLVKIFLDYDLRRVP